MPHVRVALRWLILLLPLLLLGAGNVAGSPSSGLVPAVHILTTDDQMYRLAADGGYQRVVQVFPWRDLQPARDQWHWQQPDFAVRAAEYYGLGLIVRLDHPPDWALSHSSGAQEGPIHDLQDMSGGAGQVASGLKALGVVRLAPCHCTGAPAGAQLAAAFGDGYLRCGAGLVLGEGE